MRSTCTAWVRLLLCSAAWCGGVWPVTVGVGADAAPAAAVASEFTPAITAADLDIEHCGAFVDGGAAGTAPREALEALLGLRTDGAAMWKTPAGAGTVRHFRVAFKQPIAIGTIGTTHAGQDSVFWFGAPLERTVSLLKSDAPYPGDVTNEAHWVALPDGRVKTLLPGTRTQAVRFTERYPSPIATPSPAEYTTPGSAMGVVLFFKERYYQATNLGAEKEEWLGKVAANLTAFWGEPQVVAGFVAFSLRPVDAAAQFLDLKSEAHPTAADPKEWQSAARSRVATFPQAYGFAQPTRTRGIRVVPAKPVGSVGYALGGPVTILARLAGDEEPPVFRIPPPPFSFALDMPLAGSIGLQILDKGGRLVRRLLGEAVRDKGALREPWDLVDGAGQYVPPGEYTWTALAFPRLQLTYETTINHAGQPPWWAPVRGGGGWMADHSPPLCVGAVGDSTLLLGSAVCEKGQAAIAVDLDGNKLWGESPVLTGWGGGYRVASDGRFGYIINHFGIQRVDPTKPDFAPTEIYRFLFTPEAPGGGWAGVDLGGAAARGDRLFIAHCAPPAPWIAPAAAARDLDLKRCFPPVVPKGRMHEAEYDGLERFYSTFLIVKPHDRTMSGFGGENAPGKAQELIVAFTNAMIIGSVLVPDSGARVYALKAGRHIRDIQQGAPEALPGDGEAAAAGEGPWEPLRIQGVAENADLDAVDEILTETFSSYTPSGRPGLVLSKPGGIHTEALRIVAPRLDYCLIMSHRLRDVAPEAKRVAGEGRTTAAGGWTIERPERPLITQDNPARMALVWERDVALRGLTLHVPTTASLRIDCWVGGSTNDPAASLADDRGWEQKGSLDIQIDGYWARISSVRTVDFGGEVRTRAVRIRAVLAAGVLGVQGFKSAVTGKQEAGFDSIMAYSSEGEDAPDLPRSYNERITEYQLPGGTGTVALVRHIPLPKPGYLAFGKDGSLLAASDGRIVTVPLDGKGEPREVIGRKLLEKPAGIAVDADGLLYVVDQGPQVVKVFDVSKGSLLRTIGTLGGLRLGPWDSTRFDAPLGVAIDGAGKLWVVENSVQPKRVSRWTREGVLEKSFFGPASYGGGGAYGGGAWMDPKDRSVVNFDGMKFVIDWKDGSSRLASILCRPGVDSPTRAAAPNRVMYRDGRRYLVGDPRVYREIALICEERNGVAVPMVAAGNLGFWENVGAYPGFKEALADVCREKCGFVWTDLDGDGKPQLPEVQWTEKRGLGPSYCADCVGEDFSLNFAGVRLRPVGFTSKGAPRYDLAKLEEVPLLGGSSSWTASDGSAFVVGGNWLLAPDGSKRWEIRDEHPGVNRSGAPRQMGVPVAQFEALGHLTFGKEELFVSNGNYGDWFVTSRDGLMPGWVLGGPPGQGRRHWTMAEWDRGRTRLDDLRMDAEDFSGSILQADDGRVYLIAGGSHNSVVRVDGLERIVRLNGAFKVTADDLAAARTWQARAATLRRAVEVPKIARVSSADRYSVAIDGALDEWVAVPFLPIHEREVEGKGTVVDEAATLAFDEEHLFVAARGTGPMLNGAAELRTLFQGGDALDVCLGLDPKADTGRAQPVAGDLRLVFTRRKGGPVVAALYRPATPDTPEARRQRYYSAAGGEVLMEVVAPVPEAKIVVQGETAGWTLEASIPWKALGAVAPESGARLRGDVGVLHGDQNSLRTVDRFYWAGKSQTCVSDEPTEARLTPALWGEIMVQRDAEAKALVAPMGEPGSEGPATPPGWDLGP